MVVELIILIPIIWHYTTVTEWRAKKKKMQMPEFKS